MIYAMAHKSTDSDCGVLIVRPSILTQLATHPAKTFTSIVESFSSHLLPTQSTLNMPGEGMVSREELTKRSIPKVQFSTASNPLTAPPVIPLGLSAAQRAAARFAIKGNAIGES